MLSICLENHTYGVNILLVSTASNQMGLYIMQMVWANTKHTHYTHTQLQIRKQPTPMLSNSLLLQVTMHKSSHTYMCQTHTTSDWILFSTQLIYVQKRIYFCEVLMVLPKII